MKVWKKNMVAAAVLVTVCAGIYVNWLYTEENAAASLTDTLDTEKVMSLRASSTCFSTVLLPTPDAPDITNNLPLLTGFPPSVSIGSAVFPESVRIRSHGLYPSG